MRWKLLFVAPLLAAVAAVGAVFLLDRLLGLNLGRHGGSPLPLLYLVLPPLATAAGAAVFVYRHNARRRALQGVGAALLSLAFYYAALLALDSFAR
jgi:hypothetical protein